MIPEFDNLITSVSVIFLFYFCLVFIFWVNLYPSILISTNNKMSDGLMDGRMGEKKLKIKVKISPIFTQKINEKYPLHVQKTKCYKNNWNARQKLNMNTKFSNMFEIVKQLERLFIIIIIIIWFVCLHLGFIHKLCNDEVTLHYAIWIVLVGSSKSQFTHG